MKTFLTIFLLIGAFSFVFVVTVAFFGLMNRTNKAIEDYARRLPSSRRRDDHRNMRRHAWARFKCHRADLLTGSITKNKANRN